MNFGSDQAARRRVLEAGQQYRGMTFTDRGDLLLDVGRVQDGRVTLSQRGLSMRLLPETLSGIHRAWQDGDIPLDGKDDWECSTFSPAVSDADRVGCVCSSKDHLLITNKISQTVVSVTREQLNVVVERIVDPWLASFSPSHPAAPPPPKLLVKVPAGNWIRQSQRPRWSYPDHSSAVFWPFISSHCLRACVLFMVSPCSFCRMNPQLWHW